METITLKENAKLLEKKLQKTGKFTLNDAAAITGVAVHEAQKALEDLMSKYVCHLKVTENGDLLYDFGRSPQRRGDKTFGERVEEVQDFLWKMFTIFYKAWISVMLVVYFVVVVVILIAALVAMSSSKNSDSDSNNDNGGSNMFGGIFHLFLSIFQWNTVYYGQTYYDRDDRGYEYKHYKEKESPFDKKEKNFMSAVYDFVFGPPRIALELLENQKEVAAYARKNAGIVALPEFKALAGWNTDEAQAFMSDCVVRFNGSAEISENGLLYADLRDLTRSVNSNDDGKVVWYWDEYEPEFEFTGNTTGKNALIIGMNIFNLVFASIFLIGNFNESAPQDYWLWVFLGVIPFVFSLSFFAIPALRYFTLLPKRNQRHINNVKKRLLKVIYKNAGNGALSTDALANEVNRTAKEEKLDKAIIDDVMSKYIVEWDGEAVPTSNGNVLYKFETLKNQLLEVQELRTKAPKNKDLGNIYYDSKEEI